MACVIYFQILSQVHFNMNITLLHKKRCFYSTIIAYLRIFVFVKLRYFSRLTKDSDKLLFVGSVARNS